MCLKIINDKVIVGYYIPPIKNNEKKAVSLSIIAMQYTRTLHPPGGAAALIAVIGSDRVHELGYFYVVSPIGVGALTRYSSPLV